MEIEQNKYCGVISTITRLVTEKDGDRSTYFDIFDESEAENDNSSLKHILNNIQTDLKKGLIRGHLPSEYIFGFCKSFKKNQRSRFGARS